LSRAAGAGLAASLAVVALAGCVGGGGPKGNARQGGVIRVAYGSDPGRLDPAVASTPSAQEAIWLVYTPPLTYRRVGGAKATELIPGLAERLPVVSDQGRTYSFTFRRGLRYSNGRALRAADFRRAVERVRALRSPGAELFANVVGIATNDRTRRVRIRLKRPDSAFRYALASTYAGLVPGTTPLGRPAGKPPPGIGPYTIAHGRRRGGFVLRRNASFALPGIPAGNLDAVVADVVPDRERAARAVIAGRLDYMRDPPPDALLPELRSKYRDRYSEHPTVSTLAFVLDTREAPFDDARVRRGVAYAVDGLDLKRLLAGRLQPGCMLLPPTVPGHQIADKCPYGDLTVHADLEKARSQVEKAGAARAEVTVRAPRDDAGRRVLPYYTRTLRKIGLRARLSRRGGNAQTWLAEGVPQVPYPASFFGLVAADDPLLDVDVERLRLLPLAGATERDWGKLDSRVVRRAYLAPFGSATQSTFLSERLDFDNCARFNPVYGNDYSSFCLK
jgi:peptide/nickel transport system substrate-binding protein